MSHRLIFGLACAISAFACGTSDPPPDGVTPSVEVIRPTAVETLSLAIEEHALPTAFAGDTTLSVAVLDGIGVLAGGQSGLYFLSSNGFEQLDPSPVRALVTFEQRAILIAADRGLLYWDGTLSDSPLSGMIGAESVTSLATRGDDLYFSTASALWLLSAGELYAFDTLGGGSISASGGAEDVIAGMNALRKNNSGWEVRALAEEISAARAVPGSEGRILALDAGALKQRVLVADDSVIWSPVALSTDAADEGATDVEQLAVDPLTGAIWTVDSSAIARSDHGRISKIERPAGLGAVKSLTVTIDGAVWISDGTTLRRFGNEGRPVTWSDDIATFSLNNCERCHVPLRTGHPLNSYSLWVSDIDRIIGDLEIMKMPQDGAPLVGGTVDLIRRWRDEGLRE